MVGGMNHRQKIEKEKIEGELRARRGITTPLPDKGESKEGFWFTEVGGVTVIIGRMGGIKLPAVRSYPDPLHAAVYADDEFKKQDTHPSTASHYDSGHLSPIVNTDWQCEGKVCPCKSEPYAQRLKRSRG
jgi:hypothetical protein